MSDQDKPKGQPSAAGHASWRRIAATQQAQAHCGRSAEGKSTTEALRQSYDEIQAMYDGMTDGLLIADTETKRFVRANRAICSMLGYSESELLSMSVMDIHPDEDMPAVLQVFQEQVAERHRIAENLPVLRKDGSVFYADIAPSLLTYHDRPCMIGIFRDITEHKAADDALRKVSERLSLATAAARVGVWDLNVVANKLAWDDSMSRLYGIAPGDFADAYAAWRTGVHAEDLLRVEADLQKALSGENEFDTEFRVVWPDHSVHWIRAKASVHRDAIGRPMRMLGINWDITERKRSEASIRWSLETQTALASLLALSLAPLRLQELLERSLDVLLSLTWIRLVSKAAVFVVEDDSQTLVMKAHSGLSEPLLSGCRRVPVGCCLCGEAAQHRQIVFAACLDERHVKRYPDMIPHGHYCVPIVAEDTLLGVLTLYVREGHEKNLDEEAFLASVAHVLAGILKRRQAEEALCKSEERFALAVQGTDAGIWDWDLLNNQIYYSPRWKSILGFEDHEIGNQLAEWERRIHPEDRPRALAKIRDYLDGRTTAYELEHRLQHKDGSYRWIIARGAAVRDASGRPYRMVGSHVDITERRRVEHLMMAREGELIAAQRIQEHLLPRFAPQIAGYEIAGALIPAQFAAGDYYDYLAMPDGSLGIVVGDVSGHGFSAALLMASTSAHLRSFVLNRSHIGEIVRQVNTLLCQETEEEKFVTLLFLQLELSTRRLKYVNQGHPSGYVLGCSGDVKHDLKSDGVPLGILPEIGLPQCGQIELEPHDMILLTTDGIMESSSPEGELFGEQRMLEVVRSNRDRPAGEIIRSLQHAVFEFTGLNAPQDDLTAVVIRSTAV